MQGPRLWRRRRGVNIAGNGVAASGKGVPEAPSVAAAAGDSPVMGQFTGVYSCGPVSVFLSFKVCARTEVEFVPTYIVA